jgi:hypothetical protein
MAFITLLAIAVGSLSAIALVTVGLVEAPWQLLLLGLIAALYSLQRQAWAGDAMSQDWASPEATSDPGSGANCTSPDPTAAAADEGGQELCYRGIRYRIPKTDAEAMPENDAPTEGIYRGQPWQR